MSNLSSKDEKWIDDNVGLKLRLSYSLLNAWSRGKTDEAVSLYLREDLPSSPALLYGKDFHKKVQKIIDKKKEITLANTHFKFNKPETEKKIIVNYSDLFDLKVIIDCIDTPEIYDWKSGVVNSLEYSNSYQFPLYFLACNLTGINVERGFMVHYNQYEKKADFTIIWNGQTQIERATNYIETLAPEIYEYFNKHGVLKEAKEKLGKG